MSTFDIVAEVLPAFSLTTSNQFFKSFSSFAMFIPVLFRSGFVCYAKGSIGLYFEFFKLVVPPGNAMSATHLTQGACFLIGVNKSRVYSRRLPFYISRTFNSADP